MNDYSNYEQLIDTGCETIKGQQKFRETSIKKFIKRIEKLIDEIKPDVSSNKSFQISYKIRVYNDSENVYRINYGEKVYFFDCWTRNNKNNPFYGCILTLNPNSDSYQYLKEKMDAFCEKTKENDHCEVVVNGREKNPNNEKYNDSESLQIHMKFLQWLKKYRRKLLGKAIAANPIIYGIAVFSILPILSGLFSIDVLCTISLTVFLATCVVGAFVGMINYDTEFKPLKDYFELLRVARLNRKRLKSLEKKLGVSRKLNAIKDIIKTNGVVASKEKEESNVPRLEYVNEYQDPTINRISNLLALASKLNPSKYHKEGLELMEILSECLDIARSGNKQIRNDIEIERKLDQAENRINELLNPTGRNLTISEGEELLAKMQAAFGEESPSSQTPPAYTRKLVPEQNGQVAGGH